jgi:hypothetical protein
MIVKRMRPWIVGCVDINELCFCIDVLTKFLARETAFAISVSDDSQWVNESTADYVDLAHLLSVKRLEPFASKRLL